MFWLPTCTGILQARVWPQKYSIPVLWPDKLGSCLLKVHYKGFGHISPYTSRATRGIKGFRCLTRVTGWQTVWLSDSQKDSYTCLFLHSSGCASITIPSIWVSAGSLNSLVQSSPGTIKVGRVSKFENQSPVCEQWVRSERRLGRRGLSGNMNPSPIEFRPSNTHAPPFRHLTHLCRFSATVHLRVYNIQTETIFCLKSISNTFSEYNWGWKSCHRRHWPIPVRPVMVSGTRPTTKWGAFLGQPPTHTHLESPMHCGANCPGSEKGPFATPNHHSKLMYDPPIVLPCTFFL